jgi:uncharacterized protein YdiU (UPF0061 family)
MKLTNIKVQNPYLELSEDFYQINNPTPLEQPYLISYTPETLLLLGINAIDESDLVKILNGDSFLDGSQPFSMAYAGHQFGHYNPWLGDGRAHNIGTINGWHLQLKGSGETLYARSADGRAAIRSSIREYLMSEAMFHLGIPTSRAVALIGSETKIIRNTIEKAGILLRLSRSWVRFGSFEYFYYLKEYDKLEVLAEYVIAESFSHLRADTDRFYKMFCEVAQKTAELVAQWQGVGFCHGVMNSDNISIAGIGIDYGPFAMLDDFNYNYVCNHTDKIGRYSYGEQPNISYWNLTMLAKALSPIIKKERLQEVLDAYGASTYPNAYMNVMRQKLGLIEEFEEDIELIRELVGALQDAHVDHTLFFRTLSRYDGNREALYDIAMEPVAIHNWLELYDLRLAKESLSVEKRHKAMLKTNPKYVLKNYMLEKAISLAVRGDFSMVEKLLTIAKHPYDELEEFEEYAQETPEIYKNLGLSCSS